MIIVDLFDLLFEIYAVDLTVHKQTDCTRYIQEEDN